MAQRSFRPIEWLSTGVAVSGVLGSLVVYDVIQRVAIRFGTHAHQRAVSGMARSINRAVKLSGTTMRAVGLENAQPNTPYIIVSNHQSLLDISMTSDFLASHEPRYVSKRELARGVPGVSYNLTHGGSALIDRKDPVQALAAIESVARSVKEHGWSVMIFPEGTRSKTGEMKPFRASGLRTLIANAPGVPVLPITTSGGSKLFQTGLKPLPRGVELVYRVHPPRMPPDPNDEQAFDAFVKDLESVIRDALPDDDRAGSFAPASKRST